MGSAQNAAHARVPGGTHIIHVFQMVAAKYTARTMLRTQKAAGQRNRE
jgi:hypothetical protein